MGGLRLPALVLLLLQCLVLLLLLQAQPAAANALSQCSGHSRAMRLCRVTEPLIGVCPQNVTSLLLGFSGPDATWSADGGLSDCGSVGHLKVTGWSGPVLDSGHITQLGSLASVEIVDGGLETIGPRVSTDRLTELSLARNKIARVHALSLTDCAGLLSLDLSQNAIDHLPSQLLANCRSLRTLRLNENHLAELQPDALLGAVGLREVLMQKNRVQRLDQVEQAFANNPTLGLIDLRTNELFSYQPGPHGFCGPANVTVRMHFAGCPPSPSQACDGASSRSLAADKSECVGISAHLIVTFTSCQVKVSPAARNRCLPAASTPSCGAPTLDSTPATADSRWLPTGLASIAQDATWALYALAGTVAFALLQLIVSLAICHRLNLRNARLEERLKSLAGDCQSHRYFQPTTLCSQSGLSGRFTPSGKGPSSHCGFSQGEGDSLPPVFARNSEEPAIGAEAGAEQPLRLREEENEI